MPSRSGSLPPLGAVLSSRLVCEGIYEDCLWAGVPIESVADFRNFYSSVLFVFLVLYREGYATACATVCATVRRQRTATL